MVNGIKVGYFQQIKEEYVAYFNNLYPQSDPPGSRSRLYAREYPPNDNGRHESLANHNIL